MSIIEKSNSGRLIDEDFTQVAELLGCEPAALKAVQQVETGGRGGFFSPGRPAILFEGHIFWTQLKKRGSNPEDYVKGNENILYPKWEKGHYKGGIGEYDRLEQARKINREAADASAKIEVCEVNIPGWWDSEKRYVIYLNEGLFAKKVHDLVELSFRPTECEVLWKEDEAVVVFRGLSYPDKKLCVEEYTVSLK